jgi:hypothetical protein
MMIIKLGDPPFPVAQVDGRYVAKLEHVWHAARRYAKRHGYAYTSSYGVVGVAPT